MEMPPTPNVEAGPGYVLVTGHRYRIQIFTSTVQWEGPGDARETTMLLVGAGGGDSYLERGGLGEVSITKLVGEPLPPDGGDGHAGMMIALSRW